MYIAIVGKPLYSVYIMVIKQKDNWLIHRFDYRYRVGYPNAVVTYYFWNQEEKVKLFPLILQQVIELVRKSPRTNYGLKKFKRFFLARIFIHDG